MYARAASSPELGYLVTQAIVRGSVAIEKPTLPHAADAQTGSPPVKAHARASTGAEGFGTTETDVYEMDDVRQRPQRSRAPR